MGQSVRVAYGLAMFRPQHLGPRVWRSCRSRGILLTWGAGEVAEKEWDRGCLLALTLVALQGWGLRAEFPENGLHAPLEVQLRIWAAGMGGGSTGARSFGAQRPQPHPRPHVCSP